VKDIRALFITSFIPFPINDGGRQVSSNLITTLSKKTKLDVVGFMQDKIFNIRDIPKNINANFTFIKWMRSKWFNIPYYWLQGKSYFYMRDYSIDFKKAIRDKLKANKYDLIVFERVVSLPYIDVVTNWYNLHDKGNPPIVYFSQNVESNIVKDFIDKEQNFIKKLAKMIYYPDYWFTKKSEKNWLSKFDIVSCISSEDKKVYESWGIGDNLEVYPAAFFDYEPQVLKLNPNSKKIKLLSNLKWFPNNQGIKWFISQVWNKVLKKVPDASLILGGKHIPSDIHKLAQKHRNIQIVGYVKNPDKFFEDAALTISPILSGSGIKIKVVRALYNGLPMVTTTKSLEGMVEKAYKIIPNSNNPVEFSQMVVQLLRKVQRRKSLQEAEIKLFKKHYSKEKLDTYLTSLLNKVVNG